LSWKRRRLVFALCAAPLLIAAPLILEGFRDPATITANWDRWLLFILIPWTAAALVSRRKR